MPTPRDAALPTIEGTRLCGICHKPLSMYNRSDICKSHSPESVTAYRESLLPPRPKIVANKAPPREAFDRARWEERVQSIPDIKGAKRLLRITSGLTDVPEDGLLDLGIKDKNKNYRITRDILASLLEKKLKMSAVNVTSFFGYRTVGTVQAGIKRLYTLWTRNQEVVDLLAQIEKQFDEK